MATAALRTAFYFPSDPVRQAHLGFLLAWLRTSGDRAARAEAAAVAELESVATTLKPEVERDELEDHVVKYDEAGGDVDRQTRARARIGEVLERELDRRLDLLEEAQQVLSRDPRPRNPGLTRLQQETAHRLQHGYLAMEGRAARGEHAFVPGPETDSNPRVAAGVFFERESAQSLAESCLVPHDAELQDEAVASGDAIRGRIVDIEVLKRRNSRDIRWRVRASGQTPLRLRLGDSVSCSAFPGCELSIESVAPAGADREFVLYVEKPKTTRGGDDLGAKDIAGREVLFFTLPWTPPLFRLRRNLWRTDIPGLWLAEALGKRKPGAGGSTSPGGKER